MTLRTKLEIKNVRKKNRNGKKYKCENEMKKLERCEKSYETF